MTREEIITKVQNLINQAYKYDIDSEYYEGLFDEIEKLRQPPTLAEFLGWEEDAEYRCGDDKFKIMDNELYIRNYTIRDWIDAYNVNINRFEQLRQAKQVKSKKYYAKIKGWELVTNSSHIYWNRKDDCHRVFVNDIRETKGFTIKLTKSEWSDLGINDSNADFVEVEE
ncbi:hypothetical protein [Helcococcus kunzii]|uniref:hypothetical protein n=1 Tax=Helcococcus kunzii TaxID=40091 RepID=UPI00389E1137